MVTMNIRERNSCERVNFVQQNTYFALQVPEKAFIFLVIPIGITILYSTLHFVLVLNTKS